MFFFHNTNSQLKTGKMGTHLSADTSPVKCSLLGSRALWRKMVGPKKSVVGLQGSKSPYKRR